jgi:hypothetical protein
MHHKAHEGDAFCLVVSASGLLPDVDQYWLTERQKRERLMTCATM